MGNFYFDLCISPQIYCYFILSKNSPPPTASQQAVFEVVLVTNNNPNGSVSVQVSQETWARQNVLREKKEACWNMTDAN